MPNDFARLRSALIGNAAQARRGSPMADPYGGDPMPKPDPDGDADPGMGDVPIMKIGAARAMDDAEPGSSPLPTLPNPDAAATDDAVASADRAATAMAGRGEPTDEAGKMALDRWFQENARPGPAAPAPALGGMTALPGAGGLKPGVAEALGMVGGGAIPKVGVPQMSPDAMQLISGVGGAGARPAPLPGRGVPQAPLPVSNQPIAPGSMYAALQRAMLGARRR